MMTSPRKCRARWRNSTKHRNILRRWSSRRGWRSSPKLSTRPGDGECRQSTFLANMSYEIRTPMNAIVGSRISCAVPTQRPGSAIGRGKDRRRGSASLLGSDQTSSTSQIEVYHMRPARWISEYRLHARFGISGTLDGGRWPTRRAPELIADLGHDPVWLMGDPRLQQTLLNPRRQRRALHRARRDVRTRLVEADEGRLLYHLRCRSATPASVSIRKK